jgi:hypothetical protein
MFFLPLKRATDRDLIKRYNKIIEQRLWQLNSENLGQKFISKVYAKGNDVHIIDFLLKQLPS